MVFVSLACVGVSLLFNGLFGHLFFVISESDRFSYRGRTKIAVVYYPSLSLPDAKSFFSLSRWKRSVRALKLNGTWLWERSTTCSGANNEARACPRTLQPLAHNSRFVQLMFLSTIQKRPSPRRFHHPKKLTQQWLHALFEGLSLSCLHVQRRIDDTMAVADINSSICKNASKTDYLNELSFIKTVKRWFPHNIRAIMAKIKLPKNPLSMVIFWIKVRKSYRDLSSQADTARENWTWSYPYFS